MTSTRTATIRRETGETVVSLDLNLEGTGQYTIDTGNGMLDHLLAQLSRHGLFDLTLHAKGDLHTGWHHLVEDVAIALGRAFLAAVGEGKGITRMGWSLVPLDETLAQVAVDFSGRGYASIETSLDGEFVEQLPSDLVRHFLETFAVQGQMTLHAKILSGKNDHHKAEALFKALARALSIGVQIDPRRGSDIPSTKGTINS